MRTFSILGAGVLLVSLAGCGEPAVHGQSSGGKAASAASSEAAVAAFFGVSAGAEIGITEDIKFLRGWGEVRGDVRLYSIRAQAGRQYYATIIQTEDAAILYAHKTKMAAVEFGDNVAAHYHEAAYRMAQAQFGPDSITIKLDMGRTVGAEIADGLLKFDMDWALSAEAGISADERFVTLATARSAEGQIGELVQVRWERADEAGFVSRGYGFISAGYDEASGEHKFFVHRTRKLAIEMFDGAIDAVAIFDVNAQAGLLASGKLFELDVKAELDINGRVIGKFTNWMVNRTIDVAEDQSACVRAMFKDILPALKDNYYDADSELWFKVRPISGTIKTVIGAIRRGAGKAVCTGENIGSYVVDVATLDGYR